MKKVDTDFSLQAVPQTHRKNFLHTLVVMLGLTFFSASMWSGGKLGQGLKSPADFLGFKDTQPKIWFRSKSGEGKAVIQPGIWFRSKSG